MKLYINIDGGSRGNPGIGASGCVIKDAGGKLLKSEGLFFKECTNNQAEYNALKLALKLAKELGGRELYIKADSELLVKQYKGIYKIKNAELASLMAGIRQAAAGFKTVDIKHVPRSENKEADLLCNQIMDRNSGKPAPAAKLVPAPVFNHLSAQMPAVNKDENTPVKVSKLYINIDGGSRGNPGIGASGCVIKDAGGKLLKSEGLFFKECTNNQAEYNALKLALKLAKELGGRELYIKADSELLVKQYKGIYKIKNAELASLMAGIRQAAAGFKTVDIKHVPRSENKEADLLCNQIMDRNSGKPAPAAKTASSPVFNHLSVHTPEAKPKKQNKKPAHKKDNGQLELFDLNNL